MHQPKVHCFVFLFIALTGTSSTELHKSDESIYPYLVPDLRGEAFSLSSLNIMFSSVQFSHSVMSDSLQPHGQQYANSRSLLKLMSIALVMPSNHLILCHPLLLQPSIFPSIRVYSNESVLRIKWPKYRGFSFSISPCSEYSGLISFRVDLI